MNVFPAVIALSCGAAALGQPSLRMGDVVPEISIEHWIQTPGGVDSITPGDGRVYVLDFWATWCLPCIAGFPEISRIQERFADDGVVVIAVSDEELATVEKFLASGARGGGTQGERMGFVVATDPDLSTREGVLEASSTYTLPQSMIIGRDGVVEWIGHPKVDDLEGAIESYLDGTYERGAYREAFEAKLLASMSEKERFEALIAAEDWAGAEALAGDRWERVNDIAWRLVLNSGGVIENRDLGVAERLARRAVELSGGEQGFPLHVLAAVRFELGDVKEAVELEERALEVEPADGSWVGYYTQTLARYRAALGDGDGGEE